jgi:hypothetical protein
LTALLHRRVPVSLRFSLPTHFQSLVGGALHPPP